MIIIQLVYIDETGTPSNKEKTRTYSLVSLIIDKEKWDKIFDDAVKLKDAIAKVANRENDKNFEIHLSEFYSGNRKKKNKLSPEDIEKVLNSIICFLLKYKRDISIIGVIINKEGMKPNDVESSAITFLLERIVFVTRNKEYEKAGEGKKEQEFSLLIFDQKKGKQDILTKEYIKDILSYGTYYIRDMSKIFKEFFFVNSKEYVFIQIVDPIAYILKRSFDIFLWYLKDENFEIKNWWDKKCVKALNAIVDLFHCSFSGKIFGYGLKIFPATRDEMLDYNEKFKEFLSKYKFFDVS